MRRVAIKGELADSAWANGAVMGTYVVPRIGAVRLVDLTPQRVQAMYVELLEALEDARLALLERGAAPGLHDELATVIRVLHGQLGLDEGGVV